MCFGTFDNFHPGHKNYLEQASEHGDELIVIVARDKTVEMIKGNTPQDSENVRLGMVKNSLKDNNIKGKVVLGLLKNRFARVKEYKPEYICLGYDQQVNLKALKDFIVQERFFCEIKRLKSYYPEKYKSSYCKR